MFSRHQQPIAAVATAPGRGAVGIVRVSGRTVAPVIEAVCGKALLPRVATYLPFVDAGGQVIDQGLAIHFPAPHSYTGEDVLELQAHGGPVVLQLLLARCLKAGEPIGLRVAEPGEFTERAFLNDKLDLAQAEAVADLIDASTEAAARSASRSLAGGFSAEIHQLRDQLIRLRMLVEATLDFPEEEIDFLDKADARGQLDAIEATLVRVLERTQQGALLREGMTVVLAGQPNVGKSSLLNALAGAERAIVTPIAGTTRDKVTETLQIEGVPVHVVDTAGLRDLPADASATHATGTTPQAPLAATLPSAVDEVERIGIARSWDAIAQADAVLFLHDLTRLEEPAYQAAEARIAERLPAALARSGRLVHVHNKADLWSRDAHPASERLTSSSAPGSNEENVVLLRGAQAPVVLSAKTGAGLDDLRQRLLTLAGWTSGAEGLYTARVRHVTALKTCARHLALAQVHVAQRDAALDLFAEELRLAQTELGRITGEFSADDLLGEIFSRFCIGK